MENQILNLTYYGGKDLYSDGDIEDRILEIVSKENDLEDYLTTDTDWAVLYHLSAIRHNLLDWYPFKKEGSLLEIGSGCGAMSGLFCEKVSRVVGVELSKRRSTINATRNKTCKNLEIMVGNFESIPITEKFDYVTLIGVLEYADSYIHAKQPYHEMLKKVKNYLKPDGKLIIAIENKMGLKYFAGATEDHTGKQFDGIEDYRNVDSVRTFSKPEISDLLNQCGFTQKEFYYPVPDYKMPVTVFSDKHLPDMGDLRHMEIAYDKDRLELFKEDIAFDQVIRDGQFDYFSNSFLIVAGE